MIETALVAWLSDLAPNIYPQAAPLNYSTPAVVYNRVSTDAVDDLDGFQGLGWAVIQIDVYDHSYLTAKDLAHDIRDRLLEMDDDEVHSVSWSGETDMIDQTTDTPLNRVMMSFLIYGKL